MLMRASLLPRAIGLLVLTGLLANLAYPQVGSNLEKPGVPRLEAKKIDLHKVANEDLLKQAQLVLDKANATYLAQLRELATVELAFADARKQTDALVLPAEVAAPDKSDSLVLARLAQEQARTRLEALKKRLTLIQAEKTLGEQIAGTVDDCASAALAFANLLEDFRAFVIEINLRVKDRTLTADAVPKSLEPEALAQRRRDLATEQEQWKQKVQAARNDLEATSKRVEAANKAVLEAEARFTQAKSKYAQEQKQKEVEKEYTGRPLPELIEEGTQLREEEAGLIGSFNLAMQRFRGRETEVAQGRRDLEALKAPETKMGTGGRSEDASAAIAATQALEQFHARRAQVIESLRKSLQALMEQGSLVEGEAAVLNEHLFKVQVVVGTIEKLARDTPPKDPVPRQLATTSVAAQIKALNEATSTALAVTEKAKAEMAELEPRAKAARKAEEEASKRLADLKQTQEANERVIQFEKDLRQKTATEAVAEFNRVAQGLAARTPELAKAEEAYRQAGKVVADLRKQREALKDPFVRIAEVESQGEKQKLLDELKKHAGLDRAPRDGSRMNGMMSMPTGMDGMAAPEPQPSTDKKDSEKEKDRGKEPGKTDPQSAAGFQQMLATRARVVAEQDEKDAELRAALTAQTRAGEAYSAALSAVREFALQRYAVAIDLKKRLGRGELKGEDIPEGITQALKPEELAQLASTAAALVVSQAQTRQEQEKLGRGDEARDALNRNFKETLVLISQRLDLLGDLQRLEREIQRDKKELSESEIKHLEQAAMDRFSKENTWLETLLSIDSSPQAKALVEVLQTYYREAIALESKQDLLKQAREKGDKLLELGQKETTLLQQAQQLMDDYRTLVERQREEETLLTRARLKPEEAEELLRAYQVKTGKQLTRPVPVPEKARPEAVQQANAILYERLLEVEAAKRWDRLLEGRLSPLGLPAEVGVYQDKLGTLAASYGTNLRRLLALGGKVDPTPAFPVSEEARTPPDSSEIGTARRDLFDIRRDGVLWILGKIALVVLFTVLMPPFLTFLLRRANSYTRRNGEEAHTHLVMAFMQAFLKLIVYTISLVMILSILGFDITAILAGLGIGGLAIGLAAQNALSDILGGLIIFMERPFSIGDTIRIGESEAGQVVGLTWRITRLHDPDGVAINIPNRQVTEASIINLTRQGGKTYDTVPILVPAIHPVAEVVKWMEKALTSCQIPITDAERGVDVEELSVSLLGTYYIRYMPFYYIKSLAQRDEARGEVIAQVTDLLAQKGVVIAPDQERDLRKEGGLR